MNKLSLGARLGYALGFGLWYLASLLPFWLLYRFSDLLYLLMCYVLKYRHKVIWKNLSESFPERSEADEPFAEGAPQTDGVRRHRADRPLHG